MVSVSCEPNLNAHPLLHPQLMIVSRMRNASDEANCLCCCLEQESMGSALDLYMLVVGNLRLCVSRCQQLSKSPLFCQEHRVPLQPYAQPMSLKHTYHFHLSLRSQNLSKIMIQLCFSFFVYRQCLCVSCLSVELDADMTAMSHSVQIRRSFLDSNKIRYFHIRRQPSPCLTRSTSLPNA